VGNARIGAALAVGIASLATAGLSTGVASAAGQAQVRIIDRYDHGKVDVGLDDVSRQLTYGDRTHWIALTPAADGNDGINVSSLRFSGCGMGDAGNYFDPGHTYRVVVKGGGDGGYCQTATGARVAGPGLTIVKLS
jgi:hypothetical protein